MSLEGWPVRIWLQREDADERPPVDCPDGATWCQDKINDDDVEYIRADRVAELIRQASSASGEPRG